MKPDYSKPELTKLGTIGDLTGSSTAGPLFDANLSQLPVSEGASHRGS